MNDRAKGGRAAAAAVSSSEAPPASSFAPEHFTLDHYLFFWIGQVDALYRRQLSIALTQLELDISWWRVLAAVCESPATVTQIANITLIERPTLSSLVIRMEERALIDRTEAAFDKRATLLTATAQGKQLHDRVLGIVGNVFEHAMHGVPLATREAMLATMRQIAANLRLPPHAVDVG